MAEEHRCQAQQLCVNNCGFFGSPATQNLCSKCYRDLQLKEQQSSSAKLAFNQTLVPSPSSSSSSLPSSSSSSSSSSSPSPSPSISSSSFSGSVAAKEGSSSAEAKVEEIQVQVRPNRCLTCKKRVGLTGFKCRCGMVFCGTHRYPEHHGCTFDFKAMGKEQIAKANPVVKGVKLQKI